MIVSSWQYYLFSDIPTFKLDQRKEWGFTIVPNFFPRMPRLRMGAMEAKEVKCNLGKSSG